MTIEQKIVELKRMNAYIIEIIGDEDIIYDWLACGVPDAADESDYEWIAENDDEYADVVNLYNRLVMRVEGE